MKYGVGVGMRVGVVMLVSAFMDVGCGVVVQRMRSGAQYADQSVGLGPCVVPGCSRGRTSSVRVAPKRSHLGGGHGVWVWVWVCVWVLYCL